MFQTTNQMYIHVSIKIAIVGGIANLWTQPQGVPPEHISREVGQGLLSTA